MPYEVIVKVAFTTNFIKLMLDANNLKGPGIELEFYDTTKFENMKGQITHYIALCRGNKKKVNEILLFMKIIIIILLVQMLLHHQ